MLYIHDVRFWQRWAMAGRSCGKPEPETQFFLPTCCSRQSSLSRVASTLPLQMSQHKPRATAEAVAQELLRRLPAFPAKQLLVALPTCLRNLTAAATWEFGCGSESRSRPFSCRLEAESQGMQYVSSDRKESLKEPTGVELISSWPKAPPANHRQQNENSSKLQRSSQGAHHQPPVRRLLLRPSLCISHVDEKSLGRRMLPTRLKASPQISCGPRQREQMSASHATNASPRLVKLANLAENEDSCSEGILYACESVCDARPLSQQHPSNGRRSWRTLPVPVPVERSVQQGDQADYP